MASFAQQVKSDFSKLTRAVGYAVTGTTDPKMKDPRYRPTLNDTERNKRSRAMNKTLLRNSNRSNNKSARTGGGGSAKKLTGAQIYAAQQARKKKAMAVKGRARRKKYEAAETMAKKMKLIFVD